MRIVSLQSENIKRLTCVHITPKGDLVQITGKNGNGKTSVLDSIWWALAGAKHIQAEPIRKGQAKAKITLVLGDPASADPKKRQELTVTRTFTRKQAVDKDSGEISDDGYTTSIKVLNAEGWEPAGGAQGTLNKLLGSLTFDPLEFERMKPREQFDAVKGFVSDFDFDENEGLSNADRERRTVVNRLAGEARASASMIAVAADTPTEPVDTVALTDKLQLASQHNATIETRKVNRDNAAEKVKEHRANAAAVSVKRDVELAKIVDTANAEVKELEQQITALQSRIESKTQQLAVDTAAKNKELDDEVNQLIVAADELQAKLDTADPLPEVIDVVAARAELDAAVATNKNVELLETKLKHTTVAVNYEKESEELTNRIALRLKLKNEAIAKAKLPIAGLGFDDGFITLKGLPFEQASDAERLRAAVAIASALSPQLRVIRVREASRLDDDGMELLAQIAAENDIQIWAERVSSDGVTGFVLEDGHLKQAEELKETAAA